MKPLVLMDKALTRDPLNKYCLHRRAYVNLRMGRYSEVKRDCQEMLLIDRNDEVATVWFFIVSCFRREVDRAENYLKEITDRDSSVVKYYNALFMAAKRDKEALEFSRNEGHQPPGQLYYRSEQIFRLLGLSDEWYDFMDRVLKENSYLCIHYALSLDPNPAENVDPSFFDLYLPLRNHRRYPALLESQHKRYEENLKKFSIKGKLF